MRALIVVFVACTPPPVAVVLANVAPPPMVVRVAPSPVCRESRSPQSGGGVEGSIDRDLVRHTMHAHVGEFHACYETYLERGSQGGRLNAEITIAADGSIGAAWVTGFDTVLALCVCEAVARIVFPPPSAPIKLLYPIVFEPSS